MGTWMISFHGGDSKGASPINTLASIQLGGSPPSLRELRAFTVGPDGNLYVVNAYKDNSMILQFGPASSWPAPYLTTFVDSHLDHPFDIVFGPKGNLYVSNQDNNHVNMFEGPSGANPGHHLGDFAGGFNAVRGLAYDGTYVYIADEQGGASKTGAVCVYDSSGNSQNSIAAPDPIHLMYDGQRYLYIGCGSANDVQVFDTQNPSQPAQSIFSGGANPAIDGTSGIALPGDGNIYVASRKGQRILKYPLSTPTTAGAGSVFLGQLPDQPEFVGMVGSGVFG